MTKLKDPEDLLKHLPATKEQLGVKMGISYGQVNTLINRYVSELRIHQWGQELTDKGTLTNVYHKTEK